MSVDWVLSFMLQARSEAEFRRETRSWEAGRLFVATRLEIISDVLLN